MKKDLKWSAMGDLCRRKGANAMKAGKRARYILAALAEQCPAADYTIENQNCEPSLRWLCARGYLEEP